MAEEKALKAAYLRALTKAAGHQRIRRAAFRLQEKQLFGQFLGIPPIKKKP